ncbi:MAG: hypothetical protein KGI06_03045 [Candidatus Micrarchaeota archaeon]|nr:hypothetical protein [Candidatus Micrarchaeota archaeon]
MAEEDPLYVPKELKWPYKQIKWEHLEERKDKRSISEVYLVENEETGEKLIRLANRVKNSRTGETPFQTNFNIYSDETLAKVLNFARKNYGFLGWDKTILSSGDLASQSDKISKEVGKRDSIIEALKQQLTDQEKLREGLIKDLEEKHKKEIEEFKRDSNSIKILDSELSELKNLIVNFTRDNKREEDIQSFLNGKRWLFGANVISAISKLRAGSTDIFDFTITLTDGSQRIVELKRPSEVLVDGGGQITAVVTKSLDQLIDYLDQTVAIAHSRLPESEVIKEKKPKGLLLIGDSTDEAITNKLKSWNYALHLVEIKTYGQFIRDAETAVEQVKGAVEKETKVEEPKSKAVEKRAAPKPVGGENGKSK